MLGDEIEILGHRGVVTWATSDLIDISMSKQIGPSVYETIAKASRLALSGYQSDNYVFTLDRNSPLLRDLKYLGNANNADNKCCCGGDSIGATKHSYYCPSFES